uniref:type IV pilus twitching motility protein PilT n=1 Tax=Aquicella siphonis TaxID=254247 RepID=UPI0011DD70EF|nr:type IV pilus twitching motility protein PilT [Aquicella siphonis]
MDLTNLLTFSIEQRASDVHLSPGQPPILRIDGDLMPLLELPLLDAETIKRLIYSVLDKEQQREFESALELDFAFVLPNADAFRVNIFHQLNGISGVFRVIPAEIPKLDSLGAPAVIKELLDLSSGLILVTGPTGCGKSTTLAAMIEYINHSQQCHIITIEDPIEFVHKSKRSLVHQRQIYRDSASFSTALRSALREDPDVILVGEMRDLETIRLALTAAETGHLVLATLHTSSSPRAISRVIDAFPTGEKNIIRNLISESLQAVICQTLVKRISGGRVAAFEIMLGTPAVRNLIREDKTAQMYSVIQTSGRLGMCTMEQSLQELVNRKITTPNAAHESGFQRELFEK